MMLGPTRSVNVGLRASSREYYPVICIFNVWNAWRYGLKISGEWLYIHDVIRCFFINFKGDDISFFHGR